MRQPDFVRYLNSQRYEQMLIMRGMGEKRQNVLSVQVFPYGENRKLVLSQDITELERTDAMRRDFVANVSHELKTPLTVLSGFLETMRELPLSEAERGALSRTDGAAGVAHASYRQRSCWCSRSSKATTSRRAIR